MLLTALWTQSVSFAGRLLSLHSLFSKSLSYLEYYFPITLSGDACVSLFKQLNDQKMICSGLVLEST